jgi:hypothetical protein
VNSELKDKRDEEATIGALESVCKLVPRKDIPRCDTFIEQYADEFIPILVEETNPSIVCDRVGICLV